MRKILIKEIFKKSWATTKSNLLFLGTSTFVYFVLSDLLNIDGRHGQGSLFIFIAGVVVSVLFSIGMYRSGLLLQKGDKPDLNVYKATPQLFLTVLWLTILSASFTLLGFVLLVIPGFIVLARISMASYILFHKHGNIGAFDAIKESWELTRGHTLKILLYFLAVLGLVLLSFLTLGLALVVVTPLIYISGAEIYAILRKEEHSHTHTN